MGAHLGRAAGEALVALHRRLLPTTPRVGWIPYLWLFWLIGFFAARGDSRAEQEPGRGRRVRRWHRGGAAPFARNGPELPV